MIKRKEKQYNELISKAREYISQNNIIEALKVYEEAFEINVLPDDLVDAGFLYLENKNYNEAYDAFAIVEKALPKHSRAKYALGLWYEEKDDIDKAIFYLEKAIELDNTCSEYLFDLGRLYDQKGLDMLAMLKYIDAINYGKDPFWACLNLGSLYERNNMLDLALKYCLQAYKIDPSKKMIAYNLGVIYYRLGNLEEALKYYLKETEKPDRYNLVFYNLGVLYKDKKDYETAKYYYLQCIKNDKDNFNCWYNLACCYALLHNFSETTNCLFYAVTKNEILKTSILTDIDLTEYIKSNEYLELIKKIS